MARPPSHPISTSRHLHALPPAPCSSSWHTASAPARCCPLASGHSSILHISAQTPPSPRGWPTTPQRSTGTPAVSALCLLSAFQAPTLCAQVPSLKCKLPEDRPPTPLICRFPGAQKAPGAQPSQHTAAAQTARLTRERSPHYEQQDAIFASPKWQSVFVIRPHFGEGVTQRVMSSTAAGG